MWRRLEYKAKTCAELCGVTKLNQKSCLVKITIHKDALLSGYHKT